MSARWRRSQIAVALSSLLCLASCTSGIHRSFHAFVSNPSLEGSYTGVAVKSLTDDSWSCGVNAARYFVPASNVKLFTTAAALILLGPEFRFTTRVYTDGVQSGGVLSGNLFIRGVGDPTLSWRFHDGGARSIFAQWADELRAQGVTRVTGNVVGDGGLFDGQHMGAGWAWDDEARCYSAPVSALSFDDNCASVSVLPAAEVGEGALVTAGHASGNLLIRNQVLTAAADTEEAISLERMAGRNIVTVKGSIPLHAREARFSVSIHNPALLAAEGFRRALEERGITIDGPAVDHTSSDPPLRYEAMRALTSYTSPPLSTIIRETNKSSRNLYAELLFRTMGVLFGRGGSSQEAAAVVTSAVEGMGIATSSIAIYDGSGLSRLNLATPEAIVGLLEYMHRHSCFSVFYDSLAVAGVDGTLAHRLRNTAGQGRIAAKSGRMAHVSNLSGYVKGSDGKLLAFSLMTNNYAGPAEALGPLQDKLCSDLVNLME